MYICMYIEREREIQEVNDFHSYPPHIVAHSKVEFRRFWKVYATP